MKRDMDLMLEILAYIEERPDVPVKTLTPKNFEASGMIVGNPPASN